jgi:hypothetical protein
MPAPVIVIPEPKIGLCHALCPFHDLGMNHCTLGFSERHGPTTDLPSPGPSCPGPGRYRLEREE